MKTQRIWPLVGMVLTVVALLAGMGVTASASHNNGNSSGSSCSNDPCEATTLNAVASEVRSYKAKVEELDRIIFDMDHEGYEIQIKIQECRVTIQPADDTILCKQLILDAIDIKETILHIKFEDIGVLLAEMVDQEGRILGTIEGLIESGDCSQDLCIKLTRKMQGIEKLMLEISDILESQKGRLEDGDAGEEECTELGPNCFDDVDDALERALNDLDSDPLSAKSFLGLAYAKVREFQRVNRQIFRKKKEIFNRLAEMLVLLKNGLASTRGGSGGGSGDWRDLSKTTAAVQVQLIDMAGRTILAHHVLGSARPVTLQALALSEGLPNGVYWAIVTEKTLDGSIHQSAQRLVVAR